MRRYGLVLTYLLLADFAAPAQNAARPAVQPAAQPAQTTTLDAHLQGWEQKLQDLQSLSATISRTNKDGVDSSTHKSVGTARYLKGGTPKALQHFAILELNNEKTKELTEKVVITDTFIYQFSPSVREIRYYELPKPKPGQVGDDNVMSFLFSMKADAAKKRYDLKLTKDRENDPHYVYIDVLPLTKEDKAEFVRARIVLNRDSYLPRQLYFESADGGPNAKSSIMWDILPESLKVNDKNIKRADFDQPKPPPGWKMVAGQKEVPPASEPKKIPAKP